MPGGRKLPDHLRNELRHGLFILGISQKKWAEEAGVSAALISNLIGFSQQPVKDPSLVRKLVDVLARRLGAVRSTLSTADADRAQESMHGLLVEFGLAEARLIAAPGGPISSECANYIPRIPPPFDRMDTLWSGTFILEGATQSGVSTSLLAMVRGAGKRGINASYYDLSLLASGLKHRPGLSVRDQVGYVLKGLATQVWSDWDLGGRAWNSSNQEEATTALGLFNSWRRAIDVPSSSGNRMVFWDHADHLPEEVAEIMLDGIRGMHNSRGIGSLLQGVWLGISSDRPSPFLTSTLGIRVRIGSFDEAQALRLLTTTVPDLEDPEPVAGRLFELYSGQPYLTHRAAYELRSSGVERG